MSRAYAKEFNFVYDPKEGWELKGSAHYQKTFDGILVSCWPTTGKVRVLAVPHRFSALAKHLRPLSTVEDEEALQVLANVELAVGHKKEPSFPVETSASVHARAPLLDWQASENNTAYAEYENSYK